MTHATTSLGLGIYGWLTRALAPVVPLFLRRREKRGKEDPARLNERLGIASRARPEGRLVWFHGASIGEALSILPLVDRLLESADDIRVLVTTGTVTSARLMEERLPQRALHQFVPLDHPDYCSRFLAHWRPDLGIWVESEFWPNLIVAAHGRGTPLALVNARITESSFRSWQKAPRFIAALLGRFSILMAQDKASAERLRALGAADVSLPGNLKHDAPPLSHDETALMQLRNDIAGRPLWLASNTHEGEERAAAEAHMRLAASHPGLLTLIVPRHPARGPAIAGMLRDMGLVVARRSAGESIAPNTGIYLADTLGEMGLFYRLARIAFIGGTLHPSGGHNPFEAARLDGALIAGPSDFNFAEAYAAFEAADAMIRIAGASELAAAVAALLDDAPRRERMSAAALAVATADSGATARVFDMLVPLIARAGGKAHA